MRRQERTQLGKERTQSRRLPLELIVGDDEQDTVAILAAILVDEGHAVVGVATGPQVLARGRQHRPDALILDNHMSGMSGYTAARALREMFDPNPPLLIAISEKWVGQSHRMLADLAGFNHFVQKPCDAPPLLNLLRPLRENELPRES